MTNTLAVIIGASYAILLLATAVTFFGLKSKPQNGTLLKVKIIVRTWWFIVSFLLLTLLTAPYGLILGFMGVSLLGINEYYRQSQVQEIKKIISIFVSIFVIFQYLLIAYYQIHTFQIFPLMFILVILPPIVIFGAPIKRLPEVMASIMGPILMCHFLACLPAIYLLVYKKTQDITAAQIFIFSLIILTISNDVFQFICGKMFGKRKIVPSISPNKTEAGFIGGIIVTSIVSYFLFSHFLQMSLIRSATIGATISLFGMFGDLFFSAVKRYFGTKDFSDALPGHGGYLDRLDSLIFTSPAVFYAYTLLEGGL